MEDQNREQSSGNAEEPWTPSAADVPAWQDPAEAEPVADPFAPPVYEGEPVHDEPVEVQVVEPVYEEAPASDPFAPRSYEPVDAEAESVAEPAAATPEPEGKEPWSKQNEKARKKELKQERKDYKQHKWSTRPRRQAAKAAIITLVIGLVAGCLGGILAFSHVQGSHRTDAIMDAIHDEHELVTVSETVMAEETEVQAGGVFGVDLSFIDSTCLVRYCGEIKVACDLSTAELVGRNENTYTIMLDQPYISSNTPDMERSGVIYVDDNALNRIDVTDASRFMAVCKLKVEQEARGNEQLFERARANTEAELTRLFSLGTGEECVVNVQWR